MTARIQAHGVVAVALLLGACAHGAAPRSDPQAAFMARLQALCGKAFGGRLVSGDTADEAMRGKPMVMHVARCSPGEIRIPFHVGTADGGWDRSRTWVITRTASGLRLKHDHRHEDGTADMMTMYGGDTADAGSAERQRFPVDAEGIALFLRAGRGVSVTNIWTVEAEADRFAYELRRTGANARWFRVEFDLDAEVAVPPAAWGALKRVN